MDDNLTTRKCPKANCKGTLVIRKNRGSGLKFIGCNNYPDCRYTENIEKEDELNGVEDAASKMG